MGIYINDYINDIPAIVDKEWLKHYRADLVHDADLCKTYSFVHEIHEAIDYIDRLLEGC